MATRSQPDQAEGEWEDEPIRTAGAPGRSAEQPAEGADDVAPPGPDSPAG